MTRALTAVTTHVLNAPGVAVSAGPVVALVRLCALLAAGGALLLRRRNLALPA